MKYQRVLYTKKLTAELKSKLRIASYNKRRSLKGNVYYVNFASDVDIGYADRISKHLRNITLKPFQPRSASATQRENQYQERRASSSITTSSSSAAPVTSTLQTTDSVSVCSYINLFDDDASSNVKMKERLINDVQLCLDTVKMVRKAADTLYELYSKTLPFRLNKFPTNYYRN